VLLAQRRLGVEQVVHGDATGGVALALDAQVSLASATPLWATATPSGHGDGGGVADLARRCAPPRLGLDRSSLRGERGRARGAVPAAKGPR
jgi:hypothetical protein